MIRSTSVACAALLLAFTGGSPNPARAAESAATEVFVGKVRLAAKPGEKLAGATATGVVLVTADGTAYPLAKTEWTGLFSADRALHDRPVQLTARRLAGTPVVLEVTAVHTLKNGKPHDVYYWCEHCQLAWSEPGPCKCCGGETDLVEVPVKTK